MLLVEEMLSVEFTWCLKGNKQNDNKIFLKSDSFFDSFSSLEYFSLWFISFLALVVAQPLK